VHGELVNADFMANVRSKRATTTTNAVFLQRCQYNGKERQFAKIKFKGENGVTDFF
jgi:hypothetical protein